MKRTIKLMILGLMILLISGFHMESDDKELFMGLSLTPEMQIRPNVVILMDSSGSMNSIIYYPKKGLDKLEGTEDDGFDPTLVYSGNVDEFSESATSYRSENGWFARWITGGNAERYNTGDLDNINGENNWTGCYAGDGTPNNFQVGSNGTNYFHEGERLIFRDTSGAVNDAMATVKSKYTVDGNTWFELEDIVGGPIVVNEGHFQRCPDDYDRVPVIVQLYGIVDYGNSVRYDRNYLRWVFIHATDFQRAAISHHATYGTFDVTQTPGDILSNCATPGNDDLAKPGARILKLHTRIQTAREVVCKVATDSNQIVKLGLFEFDYDNGGSLLEGLEDMSDESSLLVAYKNNIWDIGARSWTPLAETLADIWYYYKPGPASKTYWPVDYEIENNLVNHSVSNPVTPVDWWCQNNYVVIMTDGESTEDRFDDTTKYGNGVFLQKPVKRADGWEDWDDGWGDPDNNESNNGVPTNYNPNSTYCPNYTCWSTSHGSDYLDDVAYFMRHQDMFPDVLFGSDSVDGWPGDQNIYTYTIGFNIDNDLLLQTAINGDGAYYTADDYEDLVEAFKLIITSINLRNYAFSSITAPKKSTTATNNDLTASFVGYFMPSQAESIWEGHLLAFELQDLWGFDNDSSGDVGPEEFVYSTEAQCLTASGGLECERWLYLNLGHEWDAADKIPSPRKLFTHDSDFNNIEFDQAHRAQLLPLFPATVTEEESSQIIDKLNLPHLADVFHSDVSFIGPPPEGKKFLKNINPPDVNGEPYADFWEDHKERESVIYVGTNDGILHMFEAGGPYAGKETWGFIPDEVLPTLETIVIDGLHSYTVDGRISAEDIFFNSSGADEWFTILTFGLRRGGRSYYTLDISEVTDEPKLLWKFIDDDYSGQSWAKATYGRMLLQKPSDPDIVEQKWVAILPGGFAFNNENPNDLQGKAVFILDASNGEPLYVLAYNSKGATQLDTTTWLDVASTDQIHHLANEETLNYPIPTSLSAIDKNGNGYIDTIYFGNTGGHLFKLSVADPDNDNWKTYRIYTNEIENKGSANITSITDNVFTVSAKVFAIGDPVMGKTSYAQGYITEIDNKNLTVVTTYGTFQEDEIIVTRTWDPIYLSPTIMYDACNKLWIGFGSGDRDRPRTNTNYGHFFLFKDRGTIENIKDDTLVELTWSGTDEKVLSKAELTSDMNGFYFRFPDYGERLFDPEIITLPDSQFNPVLIFNTYQPPEIITNKTDNPCDAPNEGHMILYQLTLGCGLMDSIEGARDTGRIAGGGIYGGKEYILYEGTDGKVASPPGGDGGDSDNIRARSTGLDYGGGIVFLKEKKR